jgi:uncharacterized protein YjbI with pentapeptide repeats
LQPKLGILEDDFISVARSQSHIDFHQLPTPYTWEAYFRRVIDSNNDIIAIAPLDRFHASDLEILRNTIGKAPLTRAIMDLITGMIQLNDDTTQRKLLELIEECKGKQFDEIGYLAGNIVLLLLDFKHDFFKSKNLSSLCLRGFRFPTSVYTPEERRRSVAIPIQKFADVSGTQFQDSDLRDVNFGWSFENYGHFRNTNFTNTQLERFVFQTLQLDEIGLVESAGIVTLASPKELILLNRDTFTIEKRIYDENYVWHTSSLTDQNLLFQAMPRGFKVRDLKNLEVLYEQTVSPQRNPNASEPDSSWTACFAFAKDSNLLLVGCVNSFIHVFNLDNREEVQVLSSFTGVSKLSISPCERFFVSSGFHEFILWDFQNYQMLKFERYPERRSLKEYVAQFHPVESTFVLLDMNRVRIFDTSSMQFIHELQFGTDDNSSKLKYLAFSDDGALLFVGSSKEIYIIDYYKKSLVNIIRFSDNQFNFTLREDFRSSNIEDMVVDHTGQKIYLIHAMRCATEVSVDTGNITKIYWHLKDVSGANFTGATGLTEEIKDQLYKGGATI